jgi:hypothetical protein
MMKWGPTEIDQAVQFLADAIPSETIDNVRLQMLKKRTPWHLTSHYGCVWRRCCGPSVVAQ